MPESNKIAAAFQTELRRALKDAGLTIEAAADLLGITRQAFHNYLNGTSMPRAKRLAKAVRVLKLRLQIGENSFDQKAFGPPEKAPDSLPFQPTLWDALDKIGPGDLKLDVKRVGKTLRVAVRIEIPA